MLRPLMSIFLLTLAGIAAAQPFPFPREAALDEAKLAQAMPTLAARVEAVYRDDDPDRERVNRVRIRFVAGDHAGAIDEIRALRRLRQDKGVVGVGTQLLQYEIYSAAKLAEASGASDDDAFRDAFRAHYGTLDDRSAYRARAAFGADMTLARDDLRKALAPAIEHGQLDLPQALELIRRYQFVQAFSALTAKTPPLFAEDETRRYRIERDLWIAMPDGTRISALAVRPTSAAVPLPTLFQFTIYANPDWLLADAMWAAAHGYASVVAVTRGKSLTGDPAASPLIPVRPFEHDGADAAATIAWIARQPWSDGRVGMYGSSYNSFTQWAAAKHRPPALKAMATSASAAPGIDVPMQGNVFLNFMYPWPHYTTANTTLDEASYGDSDRWRRLDRAWYVGGGAYRDMDRLDGAPNPVFRRWLEHPAYDAYWQAMIPYREEFAGIDIPVLATTGYFDGGRVGVQYYFDEHTRRNPRADHTLLIGPYGHIAMQQGALRRIEGYDIDPGAMIDLPGLRLAWFDHIFKGAPKPALLRDRVNYQTMGADAWKHAPSVAAMANGSLRLYLRPMAEEYRTHRLDTEPPARRASISQRIDLADRNDADWAPSPLSLMQTLDPHGGVAFVGDPIEAQTEISGLFSGALAFVVDRRDVDYTVELYERMTDGRHFLLSWHLGRASFAKDRSVRTLLRPGQRQKLTFRSERLVSRRLEPGSRLVVVVRMNKQSDMQINYGTGGDVAAETVADAGKPLRIEWLIGSYIDIPIWR
ncbi:MAG: CocE/NonD family hydrolase [Lysobacter sp.]|nr:CocE/NonD family hydrolase [Lysobacter sp.]